MAATVKCSHCGHEIEITEALRHEVEETLLAAERAKHEKEIGEIREKTLLEMKTKVAADFELKVKTAQEEAREEHERAKSLQEQILELTKEIRKARQTAEEERLKLEKKLAEEEDKIRNEARKTAEEEQHLKILEKEKQLTDALKKNEELRQKLQQGSQQTQGEVLELELETLLRQEFPNDTICEIPKGIRGADVIQEVRDKQGRLCGTILWESKNAKWSDKWIQKLKDDQRTVKADTAILISQNLPDDIPQFGYRRGVWITSRAASLSLAMAIRISLHQIYTLRVSQEGKGDKADHIYNYLTSSEFKQRIEAIVESYDAIQKDVETERRWFSAKWDRQEKEIRKALSQTFGLYGSLQSIIGTELPEISSLKLPDETSQSPLLKE